MFYLNQNQRVPKSAAAPRHRLGPSPGAAGVLWQEGMALRGTRGTRSPPLAASGGLGSAWHLSRAAAGPAGGRGALTRFQGQPQHQLALVVEGEEAADQEALRLLIPVREEPVAEIILLLLRPFLLCRWRRIRLPLPHVRPCGPAPAGGCGAPARANRRPRYRHVGGGARRRSWLLARGAARQAGSGLGSAGGAPVRRR